MVGKLSERSASKNTYLLFWFKVILVSLLLLSVSSYFLLFQYSPISPEKTSANRSFIVKVTFTFENDNPQWEYWNLSHEERTIGLFMNNAWQTVYLLNVSYPIDKIQRDIDGNPVATLYFPKNFIAPGKNLTYQVTYRIILKPRLPPSISESYSGTLNDIPASLKNLYCREAGPWQVTDKQLRNLAFKIKGDDTNILSILKKFITWIKTKVHYETQDLPRYPLETLNVKAGDCDDQANLLIAFCRIVGIPAYLQIGCIYLPEKDSNSSYWDDHWILRLTRIGWHGWAMVYIPPWGWLPIDLTYAPGILSDPMNAIRKAAIITHPVAQYMNVTESDYVALSRRYRDFLLSNGFKIYEHDIMLEEVEKHTERSFKLPPFLPVYPSVIYKAAFTFGGIHRNSEGILANAYKMVFLSYLQKAYIRRCPSWLNSKL